MLVQSPVCELFEEFTVRTFGSDKASAKERRSHTNRYSTEVLTEKGSDRTDMRELAEACEMSAGTLYEYLGSKEEILYSISSSATSQQPVITEDCSNGLATASPTVALVWLMREFYERHDDNQDITLFAYQEVENLPGKAQRSTSESEACVLTVLEKLLKGGIEEGEFNAADPRLIAHDIVVLGHAWALRRWHLRKPLDFRNICKGTN